MPDAIAIVGLAAAIPTLIDSCVQHGQALAEMVKLYKQMDEIMRLQDFVTQLVQGELHELLTFFTSVNNGLSDSFRTELHTILQTLRDRLERVKGAFPEKPSGPLVKLEFTFFYARKIKDACAELEQWHARFLRRALVFLYFGGTSPATFALHSFARNPTGIFGRIENIRNGVGSAAAGIAKPTVLLGGVDESDYDKLPDSSLLNLRSSAEAPRLLEYRNYSDSLDKETTNSIGRTVRDLAVSLQKSDPSTMGILGCCGYSADPLNSRFALHFPYPAGGKNPRSLRNLLTDPRNKERGLVHPINDRINLACKIASAVLYVHSCDLVHKNIRPANILIFEPDADPNVEAAKFAQYPYAVGEPYLVGFEGIRKAEAASQRLEVKDWEQNIYLPPERHRLAAGDEFTMRHDIYSLGVVLLEIAMWSAFTDRKGIGQRLWKKTTTTPATEQGVAKDRLSILTPEALQTEFLRIANSQVPRLLGNKYRDVVIACLTGLRYEEGEHLLDDADGLVVGRAYITRVMRKLEDISV